MKGVLVLSSALLGSIGWIPPAAAFSPVPLRGSGTVSQPSLSEARAAFLEGRQLMSEKKWAAAAEAFELALQARNTPGLRYYIAFCLEKQGLLLEALAEYQNASELLSESPAADVEALIPEAIERVNSELPQLVLRGQPKGARVWIDGEEVFNPGTMSLNPGRHSVLIRSDGRIDFERHFSLQRGSAEIIQVKMEPHIGVAPQVAPPHRQHPEQESSFRGGVFWTSVGVSTVGLGAGLIGTGIFMSNQKQINSISEQIRAISPDDTSACVEPGEELAGLCRNLMGHAESRSQAGTTMIIGYSAFGVGVASAILTHYFWPKAPVSLTPGGDGAGNWVSFRQSF